MRRTELRTSLAFCFLQKVIGPFSIHGFIKLRKCFVPCKFIHRFYCFPFELLQIKRPVQRLCIIYEFVKLLITVFNKILNINNYSRNRNISNTYYFWSTYVPTSIDKIYLGRGTCINTFHSTKFILINKFIRLLHLLALNLLTVEPGCTWWNLYLRVLYTYPVTYMLPVILFASINSFVGYNYYVYL